MSDSNGISTEAYLDVLAAKIVAETKNAVNDGIKEAMALHRVEHEKFVDEQFKPLAKKVSGLKNKQLFRDGATAASIAAHFRHLFF